MTELATVARSSKFRGGVNNNRGGKAKDLFSKKGGEVKNGLSSLTGLLQVYYCRHDFCTTYSLMWKIHFWSLGR